MSVWYGRESPKNFFRTGLYQFIVFNYILMIRLFITSLSVILSALTLPVVEAQPLPSYSQYFQNILEIPGAYINDHCLIYAKGSWHLFYTQGSVSKDSWFRENNEVSIGHTSSPDLTTWTIHAPALRTGPPGSLDAGHVYAPSVIERSGIYYMIYTGTEQSFFGGEHLLLATSVDLFTWARYSPDPIVAPDTSWAFYFPAGYQKGSGGPVSGRAPHIFKDIKYGYICYYVARLKADPTRPSNDHEYACVAAATSQDLIHWVDRGPVLIRRTAGHDAFDYAHPESPCVIKHYDMYVLFWKGGSGTRYVVSNNPLDFRDRSEYFIATSHASEIFSWRDRWYITSCSRDVDDITHSRDRQRGLSIASIEWYGPLPMLSSFKGTGVIR